MKVRELFNNKDKWTKGLYARDKDGFSVDPEGSNAVCFCLVGALRKCYSFNYLIYDIKRFVI